jgi:hypothetical protein
MDLMRSPNANLTFWQLRCGNYDYEKMVDILAQEEGHACEIKWTIEWLHALQSWELKSNGKVIDFDVKKKCEVMSSWENSGIPAEDIPEYSSFVHMLEVSSQPQTTLQVASGG